MHAGDLKFILLQKVMLSFEYFMQSLELIVGSYTSRPTANEFGLPT